MPKLLLGLVDVLSTQYKLESTGKQEAQLRYCLHQANLWGDFLING